MSDTLWEFKYAPKEFDELILDPKIKPRLRKALDVHPNLLLVGPAGVGKGSFVNILKRYTGFSFYKLNGSRQSERGIGAIEQMMEFATAAGLGQLKYVYLNEADALTIDAQKALRDAIESVQKITRFILVANYGEKIIPELVSRCGGIINVNAPPGIEIYKKVSYILDKENVKYEKKTVVEIIKKLYPDIRQIIISLRQNVIDGILPENVKIYSLDDIYNKIVKSIKDQNYGLTRTLLRSNNIDYIELYRYIYKIIMEDDSVFQNDALVLKILGEADRWDNQVANREINFMTFVVTALLEGAI